MKIKAEFPGQSVTLRDGRMYCADATGMMDVDAVDAGEVLRCFPKESFVPTAIALVPEGTGTGVVLDTAAAEKDE